MPPQIVCDAATVNAADFGCNLLYDDHERETEHKGPRQAEAELCSDLTVCCNPTGIIICRPRY